MCSLDWSTKGSYLCQRQNLCTGRTCSDQAAQAFLGGRVEPLHEVRCSSTELIPMTASPSTQSPHFREVNTEKGSADTACLSEPMVLVEAGVLSFECLMEGRCSPAGTAPAHEVRTTSAASGGATCLLCGPSQLGWHEHARSVTLLGLSPSVSSPVAAELWMENKARAERSERRRRGGLCPDVLWSFFPGPFRGSSSRALVAQGPLSSPKHAPHTISGPDSRDAAPFHSPCPPLHLIHFRKLRLPGKEPQQFPKCRSTWVSMMGPSPSTQLAVHSAEKLVPALDCECWIEHSACSDSASRCPPSASQNHALFTSKIVLHIPGIPLRLYSFFPSCGAGQMCTHRTQRRQTADKWGVCCLNLCLIKELLVMEQAASGVSLWYHVL